jgi:phosphatidate phosphatase APP1
VDESQHGVSPKPAEKAHRAARIEDRLQAFRSAVARALGHSEQIVPFTGYGTETGVRVLCRVVLVRVRKTPRGKLRKIRGWRSFLGIPVADAMVSVLIDGHSFSVRADRGGVIDEVVPVTLSPGWHSVTLHTESSEPVKAKVKVIATDVSIGLVCDIDDTVMVTALPRPFLAAWNSFVRDEHARNPVPGMSVLLERFTTDNPGAPVIYLSTGAWNVAPTLTRFLSRHLFPEGPLLLTDWGPTHDRWFRSGRAHKEVNLSRLANEFPGIKWVLIGDDGQHDEEIYARFALAHPQSVRAIAIRELLAPEAVLAGGRHHFDRKRNPLMIPWVSAPNGAGLASSLAEIGVISGRSPMS